MRAEPGDWILIRGRTVDLPWQRGRILEVRSPDGSPPYLVRWVADDRVSLLFPGPDATVLSAEELAAADERDRARLAALRQAIGARKPVTKGPSPPAPTG
ncbi:DUF1918 domain-containing protein [Amycolatopsis cynarae]|uniref:DUF1918 domain-containing protein n=2 Tax=Amycolatopsis TaxID=1813 RepID=A0A558B2A5_9PSEU|nr:MULTISPECIES: DUF1918 domain-containing protein [Amycolatopsis]TVT30642.1 DUF1918 domain-containing protein [Amycolatopsis rhizosphaerae]WAL63267.1 DUF1918 domain-containing protein [Amycolatopsis sp. HUAS 11-8]